MLEPNSTAPQSGPSRPASTPWLPTRGTALKIVLWYAATGALWIFFSGRVLHALVHDEAREVLFENAKGWLFVAVTAGLLGWYLNRNFREIRRSARALQEHDARLRLIGDSLPDSYVYQYAPAPDGRPHFNYISAGVERVHGLKQPDVLRDAAALFAQIDPAQISAYQAAEAASARNLSVFEIDLSYRCAAGRARILHVHSKPERDAAGRVRWNGFVTDITERKQAEKSRLEISERYRSLFDNMLNGFAHCEMIFDDDGRPADFVYLDTNPAFETLTGLKNVVGKKVSEIIPGIREADPKLFEIYGRVARTGRPERFETWVEALKNWFEIAVYSPEQGRFVAIFDVITERKKIMAALRETNERLKKVLDVETVGVMFWELPAGVMIDANEAFLKLMGYSRREVANRELTWEKLTLPDFLETSRAEMGKFEATGRIGPYEKQYRRKDGTALWLLFAGSRLDAGTAVEFCVDVTERKKAEQALLQSEEQFRAMFETASVGMAQADPATGRLLRVNQKLCAVTGYPAAELLQKSVREITHPDDRDHDWNLFQSVIRGERSDYHTEKRYVRKDGSAAWVNINMTLIRDAGGRPLRTMAVIEDISERKRAEEMLELESAALNAAANAIVITDRRGNIEWTNPAFTKMTGYTLAEAAGKNPRLLKSGAHPPEFYQNLWETVSAGKIWHGEITNCRKDGTDYQEEMTITPLRDDAGGIRHFIAIKQDITARKRIEEQFRQAQKMEAVGRLAGGVAHDFNNNLLVIFGYCGMIIGRLPEDDPTRHDLLEIQKAAERAAGLTRQLLAFSRRQMLTPSVLDLNAVIGNTEKMLRRLIGEDIELVTRLAPDLRHIKADTGNMEQVLMNLAVNARDAMPKGGRITLATGNVTVDEAAAAAVPDARAGEFIRLTVSDTGDGMTKEVLARIFEPFFTTKGTKGTGLGLSVIYGIVQQHEGWITVASETGKGTAFEIYLPAHIAAGDKADGAGEKADAAPRGHGERILILEDEPALCRLAERFIKNAGYGVTAVESAAAAGAAFEQAGGQFDLLFTDVVLPDGNGFDLAGEFGARNPAMKILVTSGYTDDRSRWGDTQARNFHYLQKPYTPDRLLKLVREILDEKKPAA
jgi:two-component system, cell cycle sensor histidine kinase and response regulator CckA